MNTMEKSSETQPLIVDSLSLASLLLTTSCQGTQLGTGTGFLLTTSGRYFLASNYHVLAGITPNGQITSGSHAIPDTVHVWGYCAKCHKKHSSAFPLQDEKGNDRLLLHPKGRIIDVALLELPNLPPEIFLQSLPLPLVEKYVDAYPGMPLSVVGYPEGKSSQFELPIWKTGHIASEPFLRDERTDYFLIDATTRAGMSGSLVVVRTNNCLRQDGFLHSGGYRKAFFGIYSGRPMPDYEVGKVWKGKVLQEIFIAHGIDLPVPEQDESVMPNELPSTRSGGGIVVTTAQGNRSRLH